MRSARSARIARSSKEKIIEINARKKRPPTNNCSYLTIRAWLTRDLSCQPPPVAGGVLVFSLKGGHYGLFFQAPFFRLLSTITSIDNHDDDDDDDDDDDAKNMLMRFVLGAAKDYNIRQKPNGLFTSC